MSQTEEPEWRRKNSCIFYKLIVDSIIQDRKLQIPSKFTRKYGSQLSSIAMLSPSDGRVWIVELEKLNHNIWFCNGWQEFVEHYAIQAGYFLVFKYEGKSNFKVHIFNLAVCEVKSPGSALSDSKKLSLSQNVEETDNDNRKKVLCSCPGCPASDLNRKGDNPQKYASGEEISILAHSVRTESECDGETNGPPFCASELYVPPVTSRQGRTKRVRRNSDSGSEDRHEPVDAPSELRTAEDRADRFSKKERVVTPEQEAKTLQVASLYKPENPKNPCCNMVLRATYVYNGYLLLPRWFARRYLEGVSGFITLICGEKQWLIRCVCIDGTARLSTGWPAFVEENNLLDGDVCVLDVVDTKNIVLKVTIFRVLEVARPVDYLQQ